MEEERRGGRGGRGEGGCGGMTGERLMGERSEKVIKRDGKVKKGREKQRDGNTETERSASRYL